MRLALIPVLLLGSAPAATAQGPSLADYDYEHLAFRGVGLDFGYIWPDKVEETEMYSVRLDLGYLGPGVRVIPSISYWSSELTDAELVRLADRLNARGIPATPEQLGPIEWSDIAFSLDGHFVWNTPIHVLTYLGAGLGLHALNGQGAATDDTFIEDLLDSITAGAVALGGVEFEPVDRFRVYAEGRYTALNAFQYLSVRGGLQMMFGGVGDGTGLGMVVPAPRLERGPGR